MAYGKNTNYLEAVNKSLSLQKRYQGELEKLQNNPSGNRQEQVRKLQAEIAKLEEEIKVELGQPSANKDKIQQLEQEKTKKQTKLQILLKSDVPSNDIEAQKKKIYQEYQTKFSEIVSSVSADLTNQILTNLSNLDYNLTEITWTGELHTPSLTTEPAVRFSLK
ncbi:MAG: hypothetical protein I3273_00330 [Candidatus Moeniiplasma glomeromycotorum]|nr:hypothetical protein [Candidatus Moeniiplasma glomeromycotorum]MCE8167424.1 hypothetical protein [Candidatus Moeniiplasma glomeromycotorum]MCE8168562.1 hypothetical protein [Candidatus Moeniiplasma glomeromycotorum]